MPRRARHNSEGASTKYEITSLPYLRSETRSAALIDLHSHTTASRYKAALSVAYGARLRATEVISLKVSDIDSKRMIIRIEQGKGGKDPCCRR